jgi:hypothetical protein
MWIIIHSLIVHVQGPAALLGPEGEGPAHQDHWPPWRAHGDARKAGSSEVSVLLHTCVSQGPMANWQQRGDWLIVTSLESDIGKWALNTTDSEQPTCFWSKWPMSRNSHARFVTKHLVVVRSTDKNVPTSKPGSSCVHLAHEQNAEISARSLHSHCWPFATAT